MVKGMGLVRAAALVLGLLVPAAAWATHNSAAITAFNSGCTSCHGVGDRQLNGAGTTSVTLDHVFNSARGTTSGEPNYMSCAYAQGLGGTQRQQIANWFLDIVDGTADDTEYSPYPSRLFTSTNTTTPINTAKLLDASTHLTVSLSTPSYLTSYAYSHIETVSVSTGTLTWSGSTGTYTPPNSTFVGNVTFSYRGRDTRLGYNITGHTYSGSLRVGATPTVTSSDTAPGTVGTAFSYTIVGDNAATGWGHSGTLPAGTTRTNAVISGTPTTATTYTPSVFASNALGTGPSKMVTMNIAKGTPTLTFVGSAPSQPFSPGATFTLNPLATFTGANAAAADAALNPSYTSDTSGVCTIAGTTVTMVSAGTCTIRASTASTGNWNASNQPTLGTSITQGPKSINWTANQSPTSQNWSSGGTFPINPTATTTPVGQPITYGSSTTGVCTVAGTTVTKVRAGACTLTANSAADSNFTAATQQTSSVTINAVAPSAPAIGAATPADTQASIAFTPLTTSNDGGASILQYTATCNPGGFTGSNTTSPVVVTGLTNGQLYSCSVTATQVAPYSLTSPASGSVGVTPAVYPAITSANNTTFTVLVPGTFNITATGSPAPSILLSGALPTGVTFNGPGGSPRTLSGTPASGTVGTYNLVITADGSDPDATQNFTLTVAKRNQTVNFTDPADTLFGSGNVALVSAPSSGLGVSYVSLTPAICGISGSNATLLNVGNCTIEATAASDADWNSATQQQTFAIAKGNQAITFNAQLTPSRPVDPNQTFTLNPVATVNSPLTIAYSTTDSSICTASGTTITMKNAGICGIVASQLGDTQWNAATPVQQNVELTKANQTITFPAQAAQNYLLAGTFPINPVATASSTLSVSYISNTPSICTISGGTVTIVTIGACSIRAEQAGDGNYNAATPVSQTIQINAVVPKAPTISLAGVGNQFARINYTAPADDGGTPITGYVATCNPGGVTGGGTTSPLTVTGLVNGTPYSCTVAAVNAVGPGAASNAVNPTPSLQGAALWATCQGSGCHDGNPSGARFNYAGSSGSTAVLDYVIATNPSMKLSQLQALNSLERLDLKAYISSFLAAISETTATNLPKTISVGSHLSLNTVFSDGSPGSFSHMVIDALPANGTLSANGSPLTIGSVVNGVEVIYTPNAGYTGPDSFSYHGQRNTPTVVTGDTHTVSITVSGTAPVLTVNRIGTGTGLVFSDTPTSGIDCGVDCTEAYNTGAQVTLFAAPNPGTTFIGWSGGGCTGNSVSCVVTMAASQTVTATFDLTPFDLTVSRTGAGAGTVTSSPGGVSCGATCIAGFAPGTVVTLTPTPTAGSAFTSWGGACSGSGACSVTMDAAKSVSANFEPTYLLTVSKAGAGTGSVASSPAGVNCGATCSAEFVTGTVVSLTPTASAGSAFTGWSGACTGTGACTVTMTAARSVTATFTPTYALTVAKIGTGTGTVTSNPAGISCGATCTAEFLDTTVVNLTAAIGADTDFLGWGGDCSGTGACTVTMSQARNVTANFKSSIALTVNINGSGSGVVASSPEGIGISCGASCTVGFDPGTVVTLGRSPAAGSVFAGWSGACTGTGACVVTMSQSRSVTATFTLASGPQADVAIASHASTPPDAASVGQQVTFTLVVANNGPAGATGVILTDTIPVGSSFVSASAGCTHNAGVVTCALGSLASGASTQASIVVQMNATGGATNFASVVSAETDPLTFNNASALALNVTAASNVRLGNISTRMQVQGGAGALIGGFVIGGSANKTVAIVATGPSLTAHGITNPLANPAITVVRSSDQSVVTSNDDWQSHASAAQLQASGFAPSNALEAGVLLNLPPGAYTVVVSGGSGVAVLGIYEVDQPQVRLVNISTRGNVLTGNDVMIGGFIVSGNAPQTVAIQGIGPSLAAFGITTPLANPTITLVRASDQAVIATNDDWETASNANSLQARGFAPTNARESGLLVTLAPGAYTVILSGANSTTGIGIIGIYTVD